MPDMDEQHKSVLCVDDDPDSLKMRQVLLEANGFDVITASSASEGLSLFRSRPVNAVILDYQMPWMNGGELAMLMKGLNPAIPVMILSALPRLPEDAPRCIDAFISKCAPSAQIMAKIASLVA
jgi:CheY-like chemotaxis protein